MSPVCPVCEARDCTLFTRHKDMQLFRCEACGTVHLSPLPSPALVQDLYDDAYDGTSHTYFAKVEKKLRRSRKRMAWLAQHARGGRFLDVGCNGGFMVEAARERGFEALGLDLDPVSIRYAEEHYPKNRYFLGSVEQFAAEAPRFDLIYSSEVIEHVPDVRSFVATIARLLVPGGYLFVTTPDITHWRRPRKLEAWDGFCPPSHCIYFTPKSLRGLFKAHGLDVVRERFAWKPGIKVLCRLPESALA